MKKTCKKILKTLNKSKLLSHDKIKAEFKNDIEPDLEYLCKIGYISKQDFYRENGIAYYDYKINPLGEDYIESIPKENFSTYAPIVISIIALIGGFRAELLYLIQAIKKLLK